MTSPPVSVMWRCRCPDCAPAHGMPEWQPFDDFGREVPMHEYKVGAQGWCWVVYYDDDTKRWETFTDADAAYARLLALRLLGAALPRDILGHLRALTCYIATP